MFRGLQGGAVEARVYLDWDYCFILVLRLMAVLLREHRALRSAVCLEMHFLGAIFCGGFSKRCAQRMNPTDVLDLPEASAVTSFQPHLFMHESLGGRDDCPHFPFHFHAGGSGAVQRLDILGPS